ncbi:MAG TPA: hypothetical protein PKI65_08290 [Bacteroidales bacterium]|nr:hypothetical protein [Bacteroidales bacterium]
MGRIKVVSERIFVNGEPLYKIQHVEAAPMNKLPDSYLNGYPYCYYVRTQHSEYLEVSWIDNDKVVTHYIVVGEVYTVQNFDMIIEHVREAGERLSNMFKGWREMCFKDGVNIWKGTRVDII